jgi:hypothetical protein
MNPIPSSSRLGSPSPAISPAGGLRKNPAVLAQNTAVFQFEPFEETPVARPAQTLAKTSAYAGPYAEIHSLASQVGLLDLSDQHIERAMARGESLFVDYSV